MNSRDLTTIAILLATALTSSAGNASHVRELIEELPTLQCLGVRWLIEGDANRNASVDVRYRAADATVWRAAMPLFRVDPAGMRTETRPPAGQFWFAGSVFDLEPGTAYSVELTLHDPDGGDTNATLIQTTWSEPMLPTGGVQRTANPGTWTQQLAVLQPGDILQLEEGTYVCPVTPPSGTAGRPIAIVGPAQGEAILDGSGGNAIEAPGLRHVIFERLVFTHSDYGIAVNDGAFITVKHCRFEDVKYGFVGQRDGTRQERFYIADNIMRGRTAWPRTDGLSGGRGIQVSGRGHVVCYNRISGFDDAICTFSGFPTAGIDIYGNEISECIDDGIEMDYSEHNTRCFGNRLTSVFQGISTQPALGGPVYIFRNLLYNITVEPFKLHNSPSGVLLMHNSCAKVGAASRLATEAPVSNCRSRNNLFVGTADNYAFECMPPMRNCDFDYDGYCCDYDQFMKWNGQRFGTIQDAKAHGVYPHGVALPPDRLMEDGFLLPEDPKTVYGALRNIPALSWDSAALDKGQVIANINDGYAGAAPDLGALERGLPIPHFGPRP